MTFVRASNYWVGFMSSADRSSNEPDGAVIIKDPGRQQGFGGFGAPGGVSGMGGFGGMGMAMAIAGIGGDQQGSMIMTAGVVGFEMSECGYDAAAKVEFLERSEDRLWFRVSGDLLDFRKLMTAGMAEASMCEGMREAFVEHADFTVTVPFGDLYNPKHGISRSRLPGQGVYEKEFPEGSSLGGIATSMSLVAVADPASPEPESTDSGSGAPSGRSGAAMSESCKCTCENNLPVAPAACPDACLTSPPSCTPDASTGTAEAGSDVIPNISPGFEKIFQSRVPADPRLTRVARPPRRPIPTLDAQKKWFARLVGGQGLPPEVAQMLVDDFATMSDDTRARLIRRYRNGAH
jgi:hypothetical protein